MLISNSNGFFLTCLNNCFISDAKGCEEDLDCKLPRDCATETGEDDIICDTEGYVVHL